MPQLQKDSTTRFVNSIGHVPPACHVGVRVNAGCAMPAITLLADGGRFRDDQGSTASLAAEKSLVAQPALSTQIADLEREIGTPLFFRNKRVVRLTATGAVFLKEAQSILEAADSAKVNALRASRGEFGDLSIGFFAAPTMLFLPDLVRRFRMQYPDVTIRMFEMTPDKQLTALESGEISVAFTRPLPPGHPDLVTQILFRERLLAVVAETHRLSSRRRVRLSDLAGERFVLLDRAVAISLYDHIITACS
jgi:DNA-binding transcriptional LysR family regulator